MAHISIELDKNEIKILERRAKKNLMTLKEQIEDIIRRSCVSSSKKATSSEPNIDDKLISLFSRQKKTKKKAINKKK